MASGDKTTPGRGPVWLPWSSLSPETDDKSLNRARESGAEPKEKETWTDRAEFVASLREEASTLRLSNELMERPALCAY